MASHNKRLFHLCYVSAAAALLCESAILGHRLKEQPLFGTCCPDGRWETAGDRTESHNLSESFWPDPAFVISAHSPLTKASHVSESARVGEGCTPWGRTAILMDMDV